MRIEERAPIVLVDLPGGLGADVFHLPAARLRRGGRSFVLGELVDVDVWPALCGLEGPVYRFVGLVRRGRRLCAVCRSRLPAGLLTLEGVYTVYVPERRPSGKPVFVHARLKPAHLRVLYEAKYVGEGLGVFRIGELVWQRFGFASPRSAAAAVRQGFVQLGLELRSQPEATALKNRRHGRKPRAIAGTPAEQEYRRWLKAEQGKYRPACVGVKATSPGKGRPCSRPAMVGSEFCSSHDPARKADRVAACARMRGRIGATA